MPGEEGVVKEYMLACTRETVVNSCSFNRSRRPGRFISLLFKYFPLAPKKWLTLPLPETKIPRYVWIDALMRVGPVIDEMLSDLRGVS